MSARASNDIPPSVRQAWDKAEQHSHRHSAPMATQQFTGKAIVSHGRLQDKGWKLEDVSTTQDIQDDELVVEMVASGICHTDIVWGDSQKPFPFSFYPRVLGHEGSGYVRAVGKAVRVAQPGDPVLLSYNYCGSCVSCKDKNLSYCQNFNPLNFGGRSTFVQDGTEIAGSYFGQSSFARYSVVSEHSVVNVKGIVEDKKELQLFAPLGCGIQTGAGTVTNAAKPTAQDTVVVLGGGGVGLAAIMGAKICGCRIIVAVDRVDSRLELAKEVGATHVVNTSKLGEGKTLIDTLQEICDGVGPNLTVDTTGVPALVKDAIQFARPKGLICQVGTTPADFSLEINTMSFMISGKQYRGVIEGESNPPEYIPQLIRWYREGKFPVDKLIKFLPAEQFEQGLHEMHIGETIKPVLLWS